jgi:hypothetical protein
VIVDPANHENNVASRIALDEKKKIKDMARQSWEISFEASVQEDEEMWKEIFGPRFKIMD